MISATTIMENNIERKLSFGEKRLKTNLDSSMNHKAEVIKGMYAQLLDLLEYMKEDGKDIRCLSIAQTELETSCMYALKSLSS
jgi:hypothetical protein